MHRWFNPNWMSPEMPLVRYDKMALRSAFEKAVKRRMMSDVPWGVLLSGGISIFMPPA